LSKKLEGILQAFADNWDQLVEELKKYVQEMRQGRGADDSGLDPRTQAPFLDILQEEVRSTASALTGIDPPLLTKIDPAVGVLIKIDPIDKAK